MIPIASFFWMGSNILANSYKKLLYVKKCKDIKHSLSNLTVWLTPKISSKFVGVGFLNLTDLKVKLLLRKQYHQKNLRFSSHGYFGPISR